MQPAGAEFRRRLAAERGAVQQTGSSRTSDVESMRALMLEAGTSDPVITTQDHDIPLPNADDYWTFMLGGGLRSVVDALDEQETARIRGGLTDWLARKGVATLTWNLIFSVAEKRPA